MPCTLYYFTGTGNSLAVAQQVAKAHSDSEVVSIPRLMRNEGPVTPAGSKGTARRPAWYCQEFSEC